MNLAEEVARLKAELDRANAEIRQLKGARVGAELSPILPPTPTKPCMGGLCKVGLRGDGPLKPAAFIATVLSKRKSDGTVIRRTSVYCPKCAANWAAKKGLAFPPAA